MMQERLGTTLYLCRSCSRETRNAKVEQKENVFRYTIVMCGDCVQANSDITETFNEKVLSKRFAKK